MTAQPSHNSPPKALDDGQGGLAQAETRVAETDRADAERSCAAESAWLLRLAGARRAACDRRPELSLRSLGELMAEVLGRPGQPS